MTKILQGQAENDNCPSLFMIRQKEMLANKFDG